MVWLCVPLALVVCALCPTARGSTAAAAAVAALGVAASRALDGAGTRPSPALLLLVVAGSAAVLIVVRERLMREKEALRRTALTDPLTGIANRRSLLARADYEIERHRRAGRRFVVVMIDLDGFKELNDRFGHAAGDDLLRDVAIALAQAMRSQDTVARVGGDEFCILAPETDEDGTHRLAARILQAVGAVTVGLEAVRASAGAAVFPGDGEQAPVLIDAADQRLLESKRRRRRERGRGTEKRSAA